MFGSCCSPLAGSRTFAGFLDRRPELDGVDQRVNKNTAPAMAATVNENSVILIQL